MKQLGESSLFEGEPGNKVFTHNIIKLEEKDYRAAGMLTGMSLLHDGPGIHTLNEDLFKMMTEVQVDLTNFNLDLVPDADDRDILKKVTICFVFGSNLQCMPLCMTCNDTTFNIRVQRQLKLNALQLSKGKSEEVLLFVIGF